MVYRPGTSQYVEIEATYDLAMSKPAILKMKSCL
jgi:hypothetical protein